MLVCHRAVCGRQDCSPAYKIDRQHFIVQLFTEDLRLTLLKLCTNINVLLSSIDDIHCYADGSTGDVRYTSHVNIPQAQKRYGPDLCPKQKLPWSFYFCATLSKNSPNHLELKKLYLKYTTKYIKTKSIYNKKSLEVKNNN